MCDYSVQVHRFRNGAALSAGTGETVYMTAKEARRLARAINKIAKSIETEGFAQSAGLTAHFEAFKIHNIRRES